MESASNFTKQLKEVCKEFIGDYGEIKDKPLGLVIKPTLEQERIDFLRALLDLLLNTDIITDITKLYISDKYITYSGVRDSMLMRGEDIPLSTVRGKIWYDKNKITAIFGERVFIEVIEYSTVDMTVYNSKLAKAFEKYSKFRGFRNIALDIPEAPLTTSVTDEEFEEFISIVLPYTKEHMAFVSENIPKNVVGYVRRIMTSSIISDEDMERKDKVLELLGD